MSHRVNIVLADDNWELLRVVPKGERSEAVNQALRQWMRAKQRQDAFQRLLSLRNQLSAISGSAEDWVREDRDNHP